jgi:hypothetical protein
LFLIVSIRPPPGRAPVLPAPTHPAILIERNDLEHGDRGGGQVGADERPQGFQPRRLGGHARHCRPVGGVQSAPVQPLAQQPGLGRVAGEGQGFLVGLVRLVGAVERAEEFGAGGVVEVVAAERVDELVELL